MSTTLLWFCAGSDDMICAERPGASILFMQWILSSFFASSSPSRRGQIHGDNALSTDQLGVSLQQRAATRSNAQQRAATRSRRLQEHPEASRSPQKPPGASRSLWKPPEASTCQAAPSPGRCLTSEKMCADCFCQFDRFCNCACLKLSVFVILLLTI